jgi:hypothetical protein
MGNWTRDLPACSIEPQPTTLSRARDLNVMTSIKLNTQNLLNYTKESKKLSALFFFQFIYTKVGVEQVRHFST